MPLQTLQETFGYWVNRLAITMNVAFDRSLEPFGLTHPQWALMMIVYDGQADTPAGIAQVLGIDNSAVTRLLDRIEGKGLIRRVPNEADRRSLRIELTQNGRALIPETLNVSRAYGERYFNGVSEEDRDRFVAVARKIIANLER